MSDYLPNEVMMDILASLPVRTLLQIRCVCKSWCSLISSDNFVTFCLNRTTNLSNINNTHLLLIKHLTKRKNQVQHFSIYLDDEELTEYGLNGESSTNLTILGSCNGLVCFIDDIRSFSDSLQLCNPTIRKTVVLPKPRITFDSHGPYERALGYGFDSTTNDYKVVRIAYVSGVPEVDIYSLKDGRWRTISASGPIPHIHCESSNAYLNGAIHWVSGGSDCPLFIASFNLATEVFSQMELPSSLGHIRPPGSLSVKVFQDSLWVFHNDSSEGKASIWVMKEYGGVVESWTKSSSHRFGRGGMFVKVIGLRRNGEVVLLSKDDEIFSLVRKGQLLKFLGFCGYDAAFCVNTYTQSLVLIDKVNGGFTEQA